MHWTLDITFREDSQQTSKQALFNNLSWLRRFFISTLKRCQQKDESVIGRMEMAANKTDFVKWFLAQLMTRSPADRGLSS